MGTTQSTLPKQALTCKQLFEELDVDTRALSPFVLEAYITELRAECRFLRVAWRAACERLQAQDGSSDEFRRLVAPFRAGIAAELKAEAEGRR